MTETTSVITIEGEIVREAGTALAKSKFYTFAQNNSGGSLHYDLFGGIGQYVIVEALDVEHAVTRAKQIGLYFDGVQSGRDCSCCGDRWYGAYDDEGSDQPEVYGQSIEDYLTGPYVYRQGDKKIVFVHLLSGQITAY